MRVYAGRGARPKSPATAGPGPSSPGAPVAPAVHSLPGAGPERTRGAPASTPWTCDGCALLLPLVAGLWLAAPAAAAADRSRRRLVLAARALGRRWPPRSTSRTGRTRPGTAGVDLLAPTGSPVLAAADGTVTFAGRVAGRGVVSVAHPAGCARRTSRWLPGCARGDRVSPASVLGGLEPAPSHCAPLACLHWGLRGARPTSTR